MNKELQLIETLENELLQPEVRKSETRLTQLLALDKNTIPMLQSLITYNLKYVGGL